MALQIVEQRLVTGGGAVDHVGVLEAHDVRRHLQLRALP